MNMNRYQKVLVWTKIEDARDAKVMNFKMKIYIITKYIAKGIKRLISRTRAINKVYSLVQNKYYAESFEFCAFY